MKKLYKLSTRGLGEFYVIASNSDEAEQVLIEKLRIADYGFTDARRVISKEWLSDEIQEFTGKPNFSNKDNKLIIT